MSRRGGWFRSPLWRHADFTKFWAGQTISRLGSAVTTLALPTIAVLQLQATPFQVGLLAAMSRVAFPVLAPFAGVWVDRLPRRRIMIVSDLGRVMTLGSIPVAAGFGHLTMLHLYVASAITGIFTVFFDVADLAFVPGLVGRADLMGAISRIQFSESFAQLAGPGLAGILIQLVTAARAITVDALSFLASAIAILFIRQREAAVGDGPREPQGRALLDGLRFVFGHPVLRSLILTIGFLILGGHASEAVEIPFVYRTLGLSPGVFGLALTIGGFGAFGGLALAPAIVRWLGLGPAIGVTGALISLAFGAMVFAQWLPAFPVIVGVMLLVSFLDPIHNINQQGLRQALTPDAMQGRMNATFRMVYWGAWPLGNFIGGVLGAGIGLAPTIIWTSVFGALASLVTFATPLGRVREHPAHDAAQVV